MVANDGGEGPIGSYSSSPHHLKTSRQNSPPSLGQRRVFEYSDFQQEKLNELTKISEIEDHSLDEIIKPRQSKRIRKD